MDKSLRAMLFGIRAARIAEPARPPVSTRRALLGLLTRLLERPELRPEDVHWTVIIPLRS
jgi:hypothetical protein